MREALKYLRITKEDDDIEKIVLTRHVPIRRYNKGTRPGTTGAEVMDKKTGL